MSAAQLRLKSQQREKKARYEALYSIAGGFALFVLFARSFSKVHEVVPRIGWGLLSLWCIYFAYQGYKWIWQPQLPSAQNTLQSYRSQLEKRRDYARHIWVRAALPLCVLGILLVMAPELIKSIGAPRLLVPWVPLFVLLAVWLVTFFFVRKRRRKKLQQDIEELSMFERTNQS